MKTAIRSSRTEGTLFEHNEEVFRPSMDYSEKIDGSITINKILTLTSDDLKEEVHKIVYPFENIFFSDKVHTMSKAGQYILVDGAKKLFIFNNFSALKYKPKGVLDRQKKDRFF